MGLPKCSHNKKAYFGTLRTRGEGVQKATKMVDIIWSQLGGQVEGHRHREWQQWRWPP